MTIRSLDMENRFRSSIRTYVDDNSKALVYLNTADQWLSFTMKGIGTGIVFLCSVFAIVEEDTTPGMAGLTISYALSATSVRSLSTMKKIRISNDSFSVNFPSVHPGKVILSKKNHPDDILHQFLPETSRKNRRKIPQLHPGVFNCF